ncbi:MAG TPA: helix-turn-helix transcriptional regulator [Lentimicrobium sp.]|nr:helix-turn-helix transcriptional regulator [Lentimicrobium sp.]
MVTNVSRNFDLNARILQLIEILGITNNKFASEIGISSGRMSNIATNRNKPDSELLAKIVKRYTNVNMKWLLIGTGEMFLDSTSQVNDSSVPYIKGCQECRNKQKQIDKLQETIDALLEESRKDHELIRELITKNEDTINKQSHSA